MTAINTNQQYVQLSVTGGASSSTNSSHCATTTICFTELYRQATLYISLNINFLTIQCQWCQHSSMMSPTDIRYTFTAMYVYKHCTRSRRENTVLQHKTH